MKGQGMRKGIWIGAVALAAGMAAWSAAAGPVPGETAAAQLYPVKPAAVALTKSAAVPAADRALLEQALKDVTYYAAVAVSPTEGIRGPSAAVAANFHDIDNARRAAMRICGEKRAASARPCEVVAEVRPAGWEKGRLQLSAAATEAFADKYRSVRRAKALAVSPSTGSWGIGKGGDAATRALADCARLGAAGPLVDCIVVIAD